MLASFLPLNLVSAIAVTAETTYLSEVDFD